MERPNAIMEDIENIFIFETGDKIPISEAKTLSQWIDYLEAKQKRYEEALRYYRNPYDFLEDSEPIPDFYFEMDFGEVADCVLSDDGTGTDWDVLKAQLGICT